MADSHRWLFDPSGTRRLVLAHRDADDPAVRCVVSDVVWSDVVVLLRWSRASTSGAAALETGVLWRLAAACADLLRRLPALSDEIDEPWQPTPSAAIRPDLPASTRIDLVARRLTQLLRAPGPLPLRALAAEVDALGDAAIGALVAHATGSAGTHA